MTGSMINQLFNLEGQVALVTGAGSGIGQRMAYALAKAGAKVVLSGRHAETLAQTAVAIAGEGGDAAIETVDLNKRETLPRFIEKVSSHFGAPDILVNAAGVNLRQPADDITLESWDMTLNLNLSVPFFLAKACLPGMREKGHGKIINIGSLQSYRAFANSIPYGASKGGVAQLTRAMAEAWSKEGITTNAIAPGFFQTPLTEKVFSDDSLSKHHASMTAVGRNGELSDFDGLTVFLASKASDYISGQMISLDGGYTAK
ncbi:gluconate 5-dehydrogenase [Grimontia sp. AD028]|uniref:Gluconate 5-dehydrogenase n=2 Tax=Grimontia TaxID=246861 RepID=A0A128F7U9_9GAMM|nr:MULTISPECIES: SDR family oxidoreductase [Grimontia]KKD60118.1 gluconate 5-dehydrogenase [Grimontia sp. AD028]NGN97111.1 SDR family oxidoreductase [Grimontia sedimenti]CZF82570.1 Gluconate 5-dehydrogenase [Grimontia celer]